jgi:hypothetical protein
MPCVPIATREARAYLFYRALYIQTVPTGMQQYAMLYVVQSARKEYIISNGLGKGKVCHCCARHNIPYRE